MWPKTPHHREAYLPSLRGDAMSLCTAVSERRLVSFMYDGHERVVIPAAHGSHISTGNAVLRGYQIRGTSSTRAVPLWDLFLVERMGRVEILDEVFDENPPGYSHDDKHINVCCQL